MLSHELDVVIKGTWKETHKSVIEAFLGTLNNMSNAYVLKGGTALMECFGLNKFSVDVDLDSIDHESIFNIVKSFCKTHGYSPRAYGSHHKVLKSKTQISFLS